MGRDATKAAGNPWYQARKKAAEYDDRLCSRESAAEQLGMSVSSLADAELGNTKFMPVDKAVLMADRYNAPWLLNHYCLNECPIGCRHYLSRFSITVDLFTNGSPVVDEVSGKAVAYEDNAVDDMLSFADFLNSEHTVQWSHQNDVSILIDGDVLNLTGVVNDTSYEFRSRLTVQFYFTQKAVGASTALLESSLQYPTGEKDPETQEPTYTPTEPPETDSKSGPWGDEEEPIVVPTFEPSASGGGTEELAKEETGYFTEVEIKEETGNE